MIGYLKGKILDHTDGRMLVAVGGEQGAVGYSVTVPGGASYGLLATGQAVEFFIYTHVREDQLDLYGFATKQEKDFFLTLLSVSGIGPKGALGILSGAELHEIIEAIISKDLPFLTRIPGIGKKTAERVAVELGDSLRKKVESGAFGGLGMGGKKLVGSLARGTGAVAATGAASETAILRDAKDALLGLGFREQDISPLLGRILAESDTPPRRAEELVKSALRQLS